MLEKLHESGMHYHSCSMCDWATLAGFSETKVAEHLATHSKKEVAIAKIKIAIDHLRKKCGKM